MHIIRNASIGVYCMRLMLWGMLATRYRLLSTIAIQCTIFSLINKISRHFMGYTCYALSVSVYNRYSMHNIHAN